MKCFFFKIRKCVTFLYVGTLLQIIYPNKRMRDIKQLEKKTQLII